MENKDAKIKEIKIKNNSSVRSFCPSLRLSSSSFSFKYAFISSSPLSYVLSHMPLSLSLSLFPSFSACLYPSSSLSPFLFFLLCVTHSLSLSLSLSFPLSLSLSLSPKSRSSQYPSGGFSIGRRTGGTDAIARVISVN